MDNNFVWVLFSSESDEMIEVFKNRYDAFNKCIYLITEYHKEKSSLLPNTWLSETLEELIETFNEEMDNFGIDDLVEVWKKKIN